MGIFCADAAVPVISFTVDSRSGILHARHGHIVKSIGKCFMFLSLNCLLHLHWKHRRLTDVNWTPVNNQLNTCLTLPRPQAPLFSRKWCMRLECGASFLSSAAPPFSRSFRDKRWRFGGRQCLPRNNVQATEFTVAVSLFCHVQTRVFYKFTPMCAKARRAGKKIVKFCFAITC